VWAVLSTVWVDKTAHTPLVSERSRPVRDVCDDLVAMGVGIASALDKDVAGAPLVRGVSFKPA